MTTSTAVPVAEAAARSMPSSMSAATEVWLRGESTDPEYWRREKSAVECVQ
jgi:hypothetical protein